MLDWILGREPVATATGVAVVVTAGLGVAAAFGLDITAEQIAAIGAFIAALAGWLARAAVTPVRKEFEAHRTVLDEPRGGVPLAMLIMLGVAVLLIAGLAVSCDALFEDEDERNDVGISLSSHDYDDDDQWSSDQNNHNRRNRGAFSPGPFDDSPVDAFNGNVVCLPGSTCYTDDRRGQEPPPEGEPQ